MSERSSIRHTARVRDQARRRRTPGDWTAATGGGSGRSLNAYSPQDSKWHWLGSGGLWMPLSGGLRDGSMVLEGQTLDTNKQVIEQRNHLDAADGRPRPAALGTVDGRRQDVDRRVRRHVLEEEGPETRFDRRVIPPRVDDAPNI